MSVRRRRSLANLGWLLALLLLAANGQDAQAQQEDPPAEPKAKTLIDQAYAKTSGATTVEDHSAILELLSQAEQADATAKQLKYINQLTGWSLNRRGEAYAGKAGEQANQGNLEVAAELDAKALADFEASILRHPDHWKAVHNRAVSYAILEKYDEAMADFDRTIELKPEYSKAWYNRAELKYTLARFESAIEDYDQAIRRNSRDYLMHLSRGHAHFQLKRFRQALADYDRAVSLQPDSAETRANRADAYQSLAMWQRAADDYRRAIALDDRLGRAYQSAAWLMATCPEARFRDPQRAIAAAQQALELAGEKDFRCWDTLAAAQASAAQFDEAVQSLDKALGLAPENERPPLEARRKLYEQRTAFRQGMLGDLEQ